MSGPDPCRFLEWDSKHFDLRIARVEASLLTPELVTSIESWCARQSIDCAYFLSNDSRSLGLAERAGFRKVDTRLTLECAPDAAAKPEAGLVRTFEPVDLPALCAIARTSHHGTRFYRDGRFPRAKCDELYEIWIRKSCAGEAQAVLVASAPDRPPEGYLTCHLAAGTGSIGLVAVAEEARGKGYGRALVLESLRWFVAKSVRTVTVVTQGANLGAQRLYESCGFRSRSQEDWQHGWFREATA